MLNHSRLHLRVPGKIEIGSIGESIHQLFQPLRACRVLFLQNLRIDEQLHTQILIDLVFTVRLGQPSHGIEIVGLDPVKVVFSLGVDHPKDSVRIGSSVDMRNAPIIAHNGDASPLRGPTASAPAKQYSARGKAQRA